jgi:hypothetical protein
MQVGYSLLIYEMCRHYYLEGFLRDANDYGGPVQHVRGELRFTTTEVVRSTEQPWDKLFGPSEAVVIRKDT